MSWNEADRDGAEAVITGLPDAASLPDPFVVLDAVSIVTQAELVASTVFMTDACMMLEAAAQAACLHRRWQEGFVRQAFVLGVARAQIPDRQACGACLVTARQLGKTHLGASYEVRLTLCGETAALVSLFTGIQVCDETCAAHYREIFACLLQNGLKNV